MDIAKLLTEQGRITDDQLSAAREYSQAKGLRLDWALVDTGALDEDDLLAILGEHLAMEVVDLSTIDIPAETIALLPPKLVHRKRTIPLRQDDGHLVVATADPFDMYTFDEIRLIAGCEVEVMLATREEIDKIIRKHYGVGGDTVGDMVSGEEIEIETNESTDLLDQAQEASVIKLVNEIFLEAINERASDIHIEPYETGMSIRYRIDGVLQEASLPPQIDRFRNAIVSRIKIMAHLNIAEKRLPQDGRIDMKVGGRQIDVRVSVIPMLFGEGIVMRILDKSQVLFTLPELGMGADDFSTFEHLLQRPHGIILVTGPTGSGKTTTLYASLQAIVSPELKVITVEDPVEYHLHMINQIQTKPEIGMTFARGLRAILRHDPDVVMIGEIRDLETAEAAIQAALTGHLVFSTLHTNDACSAATRLLDMGVEPFLVTSTLTSAMAQRLVRTICEDCREEYTPHREDLPADFPYEEGMTLQRGKGCKKCHNTGYRGRRGIFELWTLSDATRELIMARASAEAITKQAENEGIRLLRKDGWRIVTEGVTTPEEISRVTNIA
ncbi:MAG: type II secretion system ATPase GspE [Phycisphaerales bacterium]|jgi:general secretion pathway protein E|nr:type II secretion system ATPase GspE [Phycisphaerales bacterium]MBT7170509.1 type II secretion system ATPase GspE [Phycisphaerales bacterium]